MTFDPKSYLIQLPRCVKDPATGQWVTRLEDYLEVKWRLCWFRDRYPHGSITTDAIMLDWDNGVAIYKATVEDGEGGKATGTGTETRKGFEDFVEKSETRALGRALAALGIGTQFVGEELSEGEHIADAPVSSNGHEPKAVRADPLPEGEDTTRPPNATPRRPSKEEIDTLAQLGLSAMGSREAFGQAMRMYIRLTGDDTRVITKKLMLERLSLEQYQLADRHFREAIQAHLETDTPDFPPSSGGASIATPDAGSQSVQEAAQQPSGATITATPEGVPAAVPSAEESSSVPDDPDAAAKATLRAEVATWALSVDEKEIEYVLSHYPAEKARALLWGSRRRTTGPQRTLTESAA